MSKPLTDEQLSPECEDLDLSHGPTQLLAAALFWRRKSVHLKHDAARYTWLRDNADDDSCARILFETAPWGWDEAIDAQIKNTGGDDE